jgi:hypothetical protein
LHLAVRLTHPPRLADRDMFMRFRGGGVGHMYMRQVEPWLDATGWGTTQPSLGGRYPEPGCEPPPHSEGGATGPTVSTHGHRQSGGDHSGGSEDEDEDPDSEGDADTEGLEDGDGEDPELPEEDDLNGSDEDEGANGGGGLDRHTGSRDSEDEAGKSETEEGVEGDNL